MAYCLVYRFAQTSISDSDMPLRIRKKDVLLILLLSFSFEAFNAYKS